MSVEFMNLWEDNQFLILPMLGVEFDRPRTLCIGWLAWGIKVYF